MWAWTVKSDGSDRSSRSAAAFGDGLSTGLLTGSLPPRSAGDDGGVSPSIAIAPYSELAILIDC